MRSGREPRVRPGREPRDRGDAGAGRRGAATPTPCVAPGRPRPCSTRFDGRRPDVAVVGPQHREPRRHDATRRPGPRPSLGDAVGHAVLGRHRAGQPVHACLPPARRRLRRAARRRLGVGRGACGSAATRSTGSGVGTSGSSCSSRTSTSAGELEPTGGDDRATSPGRVVTHTVGASRLAGARALDRRATTGPPTGTSTSGGTDPAAWCCRRRPGSCRPGRRRRPRAPRRPGGHTGASRIRGPDQVAWPPPWPSRNRASTAAPGSARRSASRSGGGPPGAGSSPRWPSWSSGRCSSCSATTTARPRPPSRRSRTRTTGTPILGVNICGTWLPAVPQFEGRDGSRARIRRPGIHSHGDGLMHIHPFSSDEAGAKATLGRYLTYGGWSWTRLSIKLWELGAERRQGERRQVPPTRRSRASCTGRSASSASRGRRSPRPATRPTTTRRTATSSRSTSCPKGSDARTAARLGRGPEVDRGPQRPAGAAGREHDAVGLDAGGEHGRPARRARPRLPARRAAPAPPRREGGRPRRWRGHPAASAHVTTPKPLLPIANVPFLERQLDLARAVRRRRGRALARLPAGCVHASTSPTTRYGDIKLRFVVEHEPLGTAGGIRFAAEGIDERLARLQRRRPHRPRSRRVRRVPRGARRGGDDLAHAGRRSVGVRRRPDPRRRRGGRVRREAAARPGADQLDQRRHLRARAVGARRDPAPAQRVDRAGDVPAHARAPGPPLRDAAPTYWLDIGTPREVLRGPARRRSRAGSACRRRPTATSSAPGVWTEAGRRGRPDGGARGAGADRGRAHGRVPTRGSRRSVLGPGLSRRRRATVLRSVVLEGVDVDAGARGGATRWSAPSRLPAARSRGQREGARHRRGRVHRLHARRPAAGRGLGGRRRRRPVDGIARQPRRRPLGRRPPVLVPPPRRPHRRRSPTSSRTASPTSCSTSPRRPTCACRWRSPSSTPR